MSQKTRWNWYIYSGRCARRIRRRISGAIAAISGIGDLAAGGVVHTEVTDEMLSYVDVLVDGEFVEAEKDLTLQFRGSRNQRILELKRIGRK